MGRKGKKGSNSPSSNRPKAILNARQVIERLEKDKLQRELAREEQEKNLSFARDHDSPLKGESAIFRTEIKGELIAFEGKVTEISESSTKGDYLVDVEIVNVLEGETDLKSYTVFWSERALATAET